MKLRIQHDTIRIRLSELEVQEFGKGNSLVSRTHFPQADLEFRLMPNSKERVVFENGKVEITVPEEKISDWAASDQITIAMEISVSNDKKLSILVEKDMKL